jgi:hypothetical protein
MMQTRERGTSPTVTEGSASVRELFVRKWRFRCS